MTNEALEQANRIQRTLDEVTQTKRDIMVYLNERMELDITIKKGLMNFLPDERTTRHYTLRSDSPLFVAIAGAIEDMREELQEQLTNLDCNTKAEPYKPIAKTSWYDKAFRWAKPKIKRND
jgi:hypothetical protein